MLNTLLNIWKVPDLRKRLGFTLAMIALYRAGSWLPTPGVNATKLKEFFSGGGGSGGILNVLNVFAGGALSQLSLFALGIMPYITASIIVQLMATAIPSLEALQKEGESGQKKLTQYTRLLTVGLATLQSAGYVYAFHSGLFGADLLPNLDAGKYILIVTTLVAGTTLLMWMGELITQRGIGNGQSLLIFASIMVSAPQAISGWLNGGTFEKLALPIITLGVVVLVVLVNEGQRRIQVQYAKRQVGRRMTGGGATYLPLRVNMAGVIPVIFAVAVLFFPPTVGRLVPGMGWLARWLSPGTWIATGLEFFLIVAFSLVYTAVIFNPVEQADNLKKYGGFIPGVRPGRPTAQYLDRVLTRLTVPGALFLGAIAVLPNIMIRFGGFSQSTARGLGGTSVLIVVGVALDAMRQMESQLMMRHYEGVLKK